MSITQATSSVLASNAALDNLNALATIAFTKAVTSSGTLNITGAVIFGNTLTVTNNIQSSAGNVSCASAGSLSVLGRSRIYSSSDGTFQFRNNANNADASLTAAGLTLTTTPLAAGSGGTGKSSLGTGVANFLETPTSNNLRAALSDDTGTGANVFADNATLTSPTINTALTLNATTYTYTTAARTAHLIGLGIMRTILGEDTTIGASPASAVVFTVPVVAGVGYILKLQARVTGTSGSVHNGQCSGTFNIGAANVMYRRPGFETENFVAATTPFAGFGYFNSTGTGIQTGISEGVFYALTSGNFNFAISNTGSGTVTLKKGSYIELQQIN